MPVEHLAVADIHIASIVSLTIIVQRSIDWSSILRDSKNGPVFQIGFESIRFRLNLLLDFLVRRSLIILGRNSNLRELLLHGLWDYRNWICEHIVINCVLHGIAIGSVFSNLLYVFCQIRELTQLSIGDLPVLVVVPHF